MIDTFEDLSDFSDDPSRPKKPSGRAFTLIELLVVIGIIAILIALVLPATRSSRGAARRAQCVNNLKQIALGLHNYESTYQVLPPAYTVDPAGKPLHSWRTLILPYMEQQQSLYESIDLSKPWNDPANAKALGTQVSTYQCPELNLPANKTTYLAIVAPDACFLPGKSRRSDEITDGTANTLMVIEACPDRAIPWMAPVDADVSLVLGINPKSKLNHSGGLNAAFADGSVKFLKATTPAAIRRAIMTIDGNDVKAAENQY